MQWKHENIFSNCLTQSQHGRQGLYSVSLQRQTRFWSEKSGSWAEYLFTLKTISSLSGGQSNLHSRKHSSLQSPCQRMPSSGMAASEHPQKAQWFSFIATWGMLTTDKLQKPQLSENGPIPWKHLCSQTVNDKGGNACSPTNNTSFAERVSGPVPGGHGHLLSCDPVTYRLSVSPSGFWKRWKGGKNKGGNNSFSSRVLWNAIRDNP